MNEKKKNKIRVQILTSTLIFTIAFFIAIYMMVNMSGNYAAIGAVAIVALLAVAMLMSALIELNAENNKDRSTQFDNLYKSEKASYIMTKKAMEDVLYRLERVERASVVPTEEIVSAQKGIAKVIINRSRENAEAIMNSNDLLNERFDDFENRLKINNREHIDETRSVNSENLQQFLEKQQEVIINLKDMELRLNSSIMQAQKMLAEQRAMLQRPQVVQQPYIQNPIIQQSAANTSVGESPVSAQSSKVHQDEEIVENESLMTETESISAMGEDLGADLSESMEVGLEELEIPEEPESTESGSAEEALEIPETEELQEAVEEEPLTEEIPDISEKLEIPEESTETEELEIPEEPEITENSGDSETLDEAPEIPEEPVQEEKPPMPDLSDPNKSMSPDEIAALLANMTQDEPEETEDVKEKEAKPTEEESLIEVLDVEESEGPALSMDDDPGRMMSPDEIAAMVANVNEEPAPTEEKPPMPDLSDPNKVMSPDEIAALIANTTDDSEDAADTPSELQADIVPDDIINEVDAEIDESSANEEEKPPMPDLSDPNKKMSPEEIAALFANM